MSRTDRITGKELQPLLIGLSFDEIKPKDIYTALGYTASSSTSYYDRVKKDDYPNEGELDLLVDRLNLVEKLGISAGELKIRFGIINPEEIPDIKRQLEEMEGYLQTHPRVMTMRKEVATRPGRLTKLTRLSRTPIRTDVPPL